jgi:predicted TPR repeat methyltransferase
VWLNVYGYDLLRAGRTKDAVQIFRLGTRLAPDWDNIADSLAEAYEAVGDRQLAIDQYRRVLELNPAHGHASARLKALGTEAQGTPVKAAGG